jgi:NADH dehydrogenase FAD-containing subunit
MVISPEASAAITLLLASAACGLCYSKLAQEPIRRKQLDVQYVKACVQDIQFKEKTLFCQPAFDSLKDEQFKIFYDEVVITLGCSTNTFNTPGVDEHVFMVKNDSDANIIRDKINEILGLPPYFAPRRTSRGSSCTLPLSLADQQELKSPPS